MKDLFEQILTERPVGTEENERVCALIEKEAASFGCDAASLPFECSVWEKDASYLRLGGRSFELRPSPFSEFAKLSAVVVSAADEDELKALDCAGKILILSGKLTENPLQPKNFPFYFPDEDRDYIAFLEAKRPAAIITVTGKQAFCGLDPAPMFDDGNFLIPSAYISAAEYEEIKKLSPEPSEAALLISSRKQPSHGRQLIITNRGTNTDKTVLITAHMDTKYDTVGALDNGSGVMLLLEAAKRLAGRDYRVIAVPFNGEECYSVPGELAAMDYLRKNGISPALLINIDSPCHAGADNAVSFYNCDGYKDSFDTALKAAAEMTKGEQWYSGDHSAFVFMGTPCAVLTSADLFTGGLDKTHTPLDTAENVDLSRIATAADFIEKLADIV